VSRYIIYHVIGRKVGMTKDPNWRHKLYEEMEGIVPEYEVLEELHISVGDQYAGDREQWWRKELNYRPDPHYTLTMNAVKVRGYNGYLRRMETTTPEQRSDYSRNGGIANGGNNNFRSFMDKMTIEERSEFCRNAALRCAEVTPSDRRSENARKGGLVGGFAQRATCPHCGKIGSLASMKRWHFDNCPNRK